MGSQEDYGWEEVYRANGCSPLYHDDALEGGADRELEELVQQRPPAVVVELDPIEEIPPKVPLLAS